MYADPPTDPRSASAASLGERWPRCNNPSLPCCSPRAFASHAPAQHGFIAQEMMEIMPEAVSGDPEGEEMMSMDYGRITPVLVAALQEANKKITDLENRIQEMESK